MYEGQQQPKQRIPRSRSEYWEDVRELVAILVILLLLLGGFASIAVTFGGEWKTLGPICIGVVAVIGFFTWPRRPR